MNTHPTADASYIARKVKRLMIIIGLLVILVIAGIIYFFIYREMVRKGPSNTKRADFVREVPDLTAANGTGNYRTVTTYTDVSKSQGVLYDTSEIVSYIRNQYKTIIARQETYKPLPDGYIWKLGFYWMVRDNGSKKQLGFYVVPVAFNPQTKNVLDYFTDNFYYHPGTGDAKSIFDEGHLWP